jgi:3-hydroxybutyryl-CoA dehydrogenase
MTIKTVGIIGAGTMGNGIAQACAVVGIDAVMLDINDAAVQKGSRRFPAASTAWSRRRR